MSLDKPTLDDLRIERRPEPPARSKTWLWLIILFLLAGAGVAFWLKKPSVIEVQTVVAKETGKQSTDRTVLNASGYVTARRAATVSSKVTGKVIEVLIDEGMKVEEGQVLAKLDDTNIKASLQLAEAQLLSAKASLAETRARIKEAEANLERMAALARNKIATQADLDHAEADATALKAKLAQQEADVVVVEKTVVTWQQQMDDTIIRAPFAGIVTSKNAQPGEMISPISAGGGFTRTGICTIVDMSSLEIEVDVNESYIHRVEPKQPVEATLDAYADWKIPCKVIAIIPTADRQKSTVKVRVGFDKLDPKILPEMGVKVAFRETGAAGTVGASVVSVPKNAVQQVDGRDVVLVVQNGKAERRGVSVRDSGGDELAITAGVSPGEKLVVDWPKGLGNGMAVKETARK
ncbi:MAG TPA: efflux RND transporter periplasmic adaptor subunit [Candidatus Dormibacteraeota bacterium]|nr:efflux RND transporter periplasmic adaptor subunit [Candidatus Dormibacteraeota bacterium]